MTRKFAIVLINDNGYDILLKYPGVLFSTLDTEYIEIIQNNKRCHTNTYKDNIQWIQIKPQNDYIYKNRDKFIIISDDFSQSLDYLISSEYNIKDSETVEWLNSFQNIFIGYQPDIYDNISQDSFS